MKPFFLPLLTAAACLLPMTGRSVEALPDLVPVANVAKNYVYGWRLDQTTIAGRVLLRLSTAMGNQGRGPLEIWGGSISGTSQQVYQRVYDSAGTTRDRLAGSFTYHAGHGHIHFDGFAIYNIRTQTTGGGVGPIISAGQKTSFCLINIDQFNPAATTGALVAHGRGGSSCGQIQGISAGYADVYGSNLPDQWVDVTNVPSGTYWLEVIADPDNHIQESDETNNIVRIPVNYTNPQNPQVNRAPVVTSPGNRNSVRGEAVNLAVTASDPDGQVLNYRALGLPAGLSINAATGTITGTVGAAAAATQSTTIIASDGLLEGSATFTWTTEAPLTGTGLRGEYYDGTAFQTYNFTRVDAGVNFYWQAGTPAAALGNDTWSVRWRGKVLPRYTETYTFYSTADDGVRLRINGQTVIDRWTANPANGNEVSGTAVLTAGQEADVVLEFYENTGDATVNFCWASASQPLQVIPANRLFPAAENRAPVLYAPGDQAGRVGEAASLAINATDADSDAVSYSATGLPAGLVLNASTGLITGTFTTAGTSNVTLTATDSRLSSSVNFLWQVTAANGGNGIKADYFNGRTFDRPVISRTEQAINFDWASGSPHPAVDADNWSARFSAEVLPAYSEEYTFFVAADNGVRLYIGDNLLVSDWEPATGNDGGWHSGTVRLTAGVRTNFRLEYYEAWGGAGAVVYWFSATQGWEVIPASRFFLPGVVDGIDRNPPVPALTSATGNVPQRGPFTVQVTFNEPVTGLTAGDFLLSNGTLTSLTGAGNAWTLTITPGTANAATLQLPAQACTDATGNGNTGSNILNFLYAQNRAPVVALAAQIISRGLAVTVQPAGSDPEGDALTWSASALPPGLGINTGTGAITGTVSATATGSYASTISVRDTYGATGSASVLWSVQAASPGLQAQYFNGRNFDVPVLTRTDSGINFDWGNASPAPGVNPDNFSVRWSGTLTPAYTEDYTFVIAVDNGVRLRVNGALLIDKFGDDVGGWFNASARLTAGQAASISVDYKEEYGGAGITVFWYSASQGWETLPAARLQPTAPASVPTYTQQQLNAEAARVQPTLVINQISSTTCTVSYTIPVDAPAGIVYTLQHSGDLRTWTTYPGTSTRTTLPSGAVRVTTSTIVSGPENGECGFFRVSVGS